ncbi:MAG: trypsin-like peptidase domain-containing protein [Candidatus Krumholzibacteria bacterium]|nr:trypsin-like peptidase domain-containing protein [Candidatus Krumholzibacteria bacterium]
MGKRHESRARVLPYVYGGVTGLSIGALVLVALLALRGAGERTAGQPPALDSRPAAAAAGLDGGGVAAGIGDDRRSAIVRATETVSPAVVSITATYTRRTRPVIITEGFWQRYYPSRERKYSSFGSGVIISEDGYIFTNYHVLELAERISVTLASGANYPAELVGASPDYDLALLKLEGGDLPAAPLGDSDDLLVGEWAIAIGSPYGQYLADVQPTVTVGVISATHRDIRQSPDESRVFNDMIQTDAAINPGNSGGPLVNSHGEVVGINTAIIHGGTGANIGMGFAIPVNRAKYVFNEIVEHGKVRDVWLGMQAADITPQLAVALDLPTRTGVLVQAIEAGGPAERAGLKVGDQLIAINGVSVQNRNHANRLVFGHGVDDKIEITVNRKDELTTYTVKLEERPSDI